jgi:hypothetical protein
MLDELQLTYTSYNGQNLNSPAVSVIRGSTVYDFLFHIRALTVIICLFYPNQCINTLNVKTVQCYTFKNIEKLKNHINTL